MPTYIYKCPYGCGKFEVTRKLEDYSPEEQCPNCSATSQRVITSVGVSFNTGGFYCMDNRKNNI